MQDSNGRLTMNLAEFAAATGCSRNLTYLLARQDRLPVPVIFMGQKRMVVSRRAVEALLAVDKPKGSSLRGGPESGEH